MNRRFIDMIKIAFSVVQEAENVLKIPFKKLNYGFFEFIEFAFWAGQEAENEFAVDCNH